VRRLLCTSLVAVGFFVGEAASADVATVLGSDRAVYGRSGDTIVRGKCPRDLTIYDRTTCTIESDYVNRELFWREIGALRGQRIPQLEREIADAFTRIAQIDARLEEYLAVDPTTPDPQLVDNVEAAVAALAAADSELNLLNIERARIETRLASEPNPDLREQLEALRLRIGNASSLRQDLATRVAAARAALIASRSAQIDQNIFRSLQEERRRYVARAGNARAALGVEVEQLAVLARTLEALDEQGFTHYVFSLNDTPLFDAATWFDVAFQRARAAELVFVMIPGEGDQMRARIASEGTGVESITCSLQLPSDYQCEGVAIRGPGLLPGAPSAYVEATNFTVRFDNYRDRPGDDAFFRIFRTSPVGDWDLRPVCRFMRVGGSRPGAEGGSCRITLRRIR